MHGRAFDVGATDACKGVALLLLLWHHLFYLHPEYGPLVQVTARLAKVCVAVFVLLSGYGLAASVEPGTTSLAAFYRERLSKLYLNYWLIAAIFIGIGVATGLRPIAAAYGPLPYAKLALQLLGLDQYLVGGEGYNGTWWFMGLIVPLYLLFPFLSDLTRKYGWWFLPLTMVLLIDKGVRVLMLQWWLFPFCLGIYAAQRNALSRLSRRLAPLGPWRFALLAALLAATAAARQTLFRGGVQIDAVFGGLVVLLTFEATGAWPRLRAPLGFLGRHLFNVFLFHTFVYYYFLPRLVYAPGNPLAILGLLLGVCLAVSMLIERAKALLGFPRLQAAIERVPVPGTPLL
jgi:membrane-bound acyltransferase YfiQ involved in biofilm formation